MRCKTCDYPLWTIRARVCPECGSPFAPSEFEFNLNSVRFCCPHCNQAYFGTGVKGHLEPRSFECIGCRRYIDMDDTVVLPREGIDERQTQVRRLPWTDMTKGFLSRFFGMVGWGMGRPGEIGRGLPASMTVSSALGFSLLVNIIGTVLGIGTVFLLIMLPLLFSGPGGGGAAGMSMFMLLAWFGVSILGWLIGVLLWALLTHWFIGGVRREGVTIGRTIQVLCLTSGPMIITAVPCLGMYGLQYAGGIWWIICAAIALRALHGCSGVRATFATLIPPMIPILAAIGFVVFVFYTTFNSAATAANRVGTTWSQMNQTSTESLASAIATEATMRGGAYPAHGGELLAGGRAQSREFFVFTNLSDSIGTPRYQNVDQFTWDAQALQDARAALPADVVAHRVGDVVFTWHGFTPTTDTELWIAVMAPPTGTRSFRQSEAWWAVEADGDVVEVPFDQRDSVVEAQNALRSDYGLPALPVLEWVTEAKPATP